MPKTSENKATTVSDTVRACSVFERRLYRTRGASRMAAPGLNNRTSQSMQYLNTAAHQMRKKVELFEAASSSSYIKRALQSDGLFLEVVAMFRRLLAPKNRTRNLSVCQHIKLYSKTRAKSDIMQLRTQYLLLLFVFGVIAKGMVKVR